MKNEEEKYKIIGSRIKEAREGAHMSQKELAEAIGFESGTAISFIESGERKVSIADLEKIARVLEKGMGFFLGIEKEKKVDIRYALRADKTLMKEDQEKILDFIDFIKSRKHGKRKD